MPVGPLSALRFGAGGRRRDSATAAVRGGEGAPPAAASPPRTMSQRPTALTATRSVRRRGDEPGSPGGTGRAGRGPGGTCRRARGDSLTPPASAPREREGRASDLSAKHDVWGRKDGRGADGRRREAGRRLACGRRPVPCAWPCDGVAGPEAPAALPVRVLAPRVVAIVSGPLTPPPPRGRLRRTRAHERDARR